LFHLLVIILIPFIASSIIITPFPTSSIAEAPKKMQRAYSGGTLLNCSCATFSNFFAFFSDNPFHLKCFLHQLAKILHKSFIIIYNKRNRNFCLSLTRPGSILRIILVAGLEGFGT